MEGKYEIEMGETVNVHTGELESRVGITATQDQIDILKMFANVEHDEFLRPVYIINDCRFTIREEVFTGDF